MATATERGAGHLAYYEEHQISPVHYKGTAEEHFDRRDALYRALGLPPMAFLGARVLEVAAGTGQNSLYVASRRPARFELVEPNPTGRKHIEATYAAFGESHTTPHIHPVMLQDFQPDAPFDVVICEQWLGGLPSELALVKKLGSFVAPGGVMVITVVPTSGVFANLMRKLLSLRLVSPDMSFEEQTRVLTKTFGPHLSTMGSMTRSHEDWVQDCMINPAFVHVVLPLEALIDTLGDELEMLATFPRFDTDWRWYKGLIGEARAFNAHVLESYRANILNFIDHRTTLPPLDPAEAAPLGAAFAEVHRAAIDYEEQSTAGDADDSRVSEALRRVSAEIDRLAPIFSGALKELSAVWAKPDLKPEDVAGMKLFGPMFGRELVHVSLTRPRA